MRPRPLQWENYRAGEEEFRLSDRHLDPRRPAYRGPQAGAAPGMHQARSPDSARSRMAR